MLLSRSFSRKGVPFQLLPLRSHSSSAVRSSAIQPAFTNTDTATTAAPSKGERTVEIRQQPITFYRRPLPASLVSFTSEEGKRIFLESLRDGYAENYFPLVGNFTTQSEPAFCGPGSLAMVLNALEIDPGRQWKGIWRWYSDDNLECCIAESRDIKERGITFREFACLSRCNGLQVQAKRVDRTSRQEFIEDLKWVCSRNDAHMVVSFHRRTLGQTGDGHFSPVGLYNDSRKMALILDTARFKYPSYYVPVDELYEAMKPTDKETGLPRGYFLLTRNALRPPNQYYHPLSLCKLTKSLGVTNPKLAHLFCAQLPEQIREKQPSSLAEAFRLVLNAVPMEYSALIRITDASKIVDLAAPPGGESVQERYAHDLLRLFQETQKNPIYALVQLAQQQQQQSESSITTTNTTLATIFILASPLEIYRTLPSHLLKELYAYRDISKMSELMREEVSRIAEQLSSLMNDYCRCHHRQAAFEQLPAVRIQKALEHTMCSLPRSTNAQQQQPNDRGNPREESCEKSRRSDQLRK